MAKKPKTAKPKATPPAKETAPEAPGGSKTAAIKAALKAHPKKQSKEIAELLQADGWDITPLYVSAVKSKMKARSGQEGRPRTVAGSSTGRPEGRRLGRRTLQGEEAGQGAGRDQAGQDRRRRAGAAAGLRQRWVTTRCRATAVVESRTAAPEVVFPKGDRPQRAMEACWKSLGLRAAAQARHDHKRRGGQR